MPENIRKNPKRFSKSFFVLSCLTAFFSALFLISLWHSDFWKNQKAAFVYVAQEISLSLDLRLNEIFLKGRERTSKNELLEALNAERGMPILAVNLKKAKENIEKLPWIKEVRIERRLPHILYVEVREKKPIAVWQHKGKYNPIDEQGRIVKSDVRDLKGFPLIVGEKAPEKVPELLNFLKQEPTLFARVKAATYMSNRRWDVILDSVENGIIVRLPDKNPQSEWSRLERLNRTHGLLKRTVTLIDLRFPDKVVVQFEKAKKQKKKTSSLEIKKDTGI